MLMYFGYYFNITAYVVIILYEYQSSSELKAEMLMYFGYYFNITVYVVIILTAIEQQQSVIIKGL